MKRTPEDTEFASQFGRELRLKYDEAKRRGVSDEEFAKSIGVVRAQLDKYLRGQAMPGVRTIALAHKAYGISTPYAGILTSKALTGRRRHRLKEVPNQLELPFVLSAEGPGQFDLKVRPVSSRKFAFDLIIRNAG